MNMKHLLPLLLLISFTVYTQDIAVLKHTNYTSHYSKSKHYPVLVEWTITKSMVGCPTPLKRKDNFKPDPQLPSETNLLNDYVKSGFDRGHLMPAADNLCQTPQVQDESFYFSNMAAQYHSLNAGDWKGVETLSRDLALVTGDVKVWAGNIGELKKIGTTSVPLQCWKVIYVKATGQWLAYLFNNDQSKPDGYNNNQVTKEFIEKLTGLKFAP
jgi:endonuclease G, mitochondrial